MSGFNDILNCALSALVLASSLAALTLAAESWRIQRSSLDLAYCISVLCIMAALIFGQLGQSYGAGPLAVFSAQLTLQLAIAGITFFLLLCASIIGFEVHLIWMVQTLLGILFALWAACGLPFSNAVTSIRADMNVMASASLCLLLGWHAFRARRLRGWSVFAVGLCGLVVCARIMLKLTALDKDAYMTLLAFITMLMLLWLSMTDRVAMRTNEDLNEEDDGTSSAWVSITNNMSGRPDRSAEVAVANERRRIAHDLHDGVCTQLVYILSSLNPMAPGQKGMALALEQCLLDLKFTVDDIDRKNDSALDALGRLRYRIQPLLERMEVQMAWSIDTDGPLQELRGEDAKHITRIAQEGLSNSMRHANATHIEVHCHYLREMHCIHLDISDNGTGMELEKSSASLGKGLAYMHWRSNELGGRLYVTSKPGAGVRLHLLVPLPGAAPI